MTDDLMTRLRAADPVPEPIVAPPTEWLIARLETVGEVAPRASRARRRRLRVLLPVFATALAAAVVLLFARGSSPDVVAEAAAALGTPGEIVHTVTRTEEFTPAGRPKSLGNYMRLGENSDRDEEWAALNPLRTHTRKTILPPGGGAPLSLDFDYANGVDRMARSWSDALHVTVMPADQVADYEAANTGSASALDAGADPVAGIRTLLADGKLTPAGETDLGGRHVLQLRGQRSGHLGNLPSEPVITVGVEYLVDAKTYEPVQVSYRISPSSVTGTSLVRKTFVTFETLPLAGNEALLRIPDADQRRVVRHR
jgi:hypothetical protein